MNKIIIDQLCIFISAGTDFTMETHLTSSLLTSFSLTFSSTSSTGGKKKKQNFGGFLFYFVYFLLCNVPPSPLFLGVCAGFPGALLPILGEGSMSILAGLVLWYPAYLFGTDSQPLADFPLSQKWALWFQHHEVGQWTLSFGVLSSSLLRVCLTLSQEIWEDTNKWGKPQGKTTLQTSVRMKTNLCGILPQQALCPVVNERQFP